MTDTQAPLQTQDQPAPNARDLNTAILACFSPETLTPAFEDRLVELTAALTNQRNVAIWVRPKADEPPQSIAQTPAAQIGDAERSLAADVLAQSKEAASATISGSEGYLAATVALPQGRKAALLVALPASGAMARSLVYERLTLLANLSFAQFHHSDLVAQSNMIRTLGDIARGDLTKLQDIADVLAQLTGADYAAAGYHAAGSVSEVAISGQAGQAKRAQLPAKLRSTMSDMAAKQVSNADHVFASSNGTDGLALVLNKPTRNAGMLQLAGSVFQQAQHSKPASKWTTARFAKMAASVLILGAIALIPIPDGVDIPARVEASERRVVTAPLSAPIADILVKDKQSVIGGQTPLVTLETRDLDLDIIGATAERATAVLEREAARANRNPALLRNAELDVQRIEARIALLELQRDSSTLIAPISGIIVLQDLEQRVGSFVRQGDVLLEVANPDDLRLSIAIVESKISKVQDDAKGIFRPDFDPTLRLPATISSISPSIDNAEDVPVINARAQFDDAPTNLRSGISGIFSVTQDSKPIGLVVYHALRDWVLLRVWI